MVPSSSRIVSICLIGLVIALLLVGAVSGTFLRHIVQVLPILVAAGAVTRWREWGAYAAVPIFLFWLFIVVLIWLSLLGLSRVASGQYTALEIVATFFMAGFAVFGVGASIAVGRTLRPGVRAMAVVFFAALQVVAMWVSFLKPIANR